MTKTDREIRRLARGIIPVGGGAYPIWLYREYFRLILDEPALDDDDTRALLRAYDERGTP